MNTLVNLGFHYAAANALVIVPKLRHFIEVIQVATIEDGFALQ